MRLLVIGETGQLAQALRREGEARGLGMTTLNRAELELTWNAARMDGAIEPRLEDADAVILAAAYTAVDAAEDDAATARAVNASAPGTIAQLCARADVPLVHISTDYVFDGTGDTPYPTDYPPAPLSVYGLTKRDGERAVLDSGARAAVLRTSWVFDATSRNFLTTMLRLAKTRETISVVDDQIGRPTYAGHLAQAVLKAANGLVSGQPGGLYHVTGSGHPVSWKGFAEAIFEAAGLEVDVRAISTAEFPTKARRPAWSVLSLERFEKHFAHPLPSWQAGLQAALDERARYAGAGDAER